MIGHIRPCTSNAPPTVRVHRTRPVSAAPTGRLLPKVGIRASTRRSVLKSQRRGRSMKVLYPSVGQSILRGDCITCSLSLCVCVYQCHSPHIRIFHHIFQITFCTMRRWTTCSRLRMSFWLRNVCCAVRGNKKWLEWSGRVYTKWDYSADCNVHECTVTQLVQSPRALSVYYWEYFQPDCVLFDECWLYFITLLGDENLYFEEMLFAVIWCGFSLWICDTLFAPSLFLKCK